jgi:type II secretory pathway component PulF
VLRAARLTAQGAWGRTVLRPRCPPDRIELWLRAVSAMLASGVPLTRALRVAGARAPAALREASDRIASGVESGVPLPRLLQGERLFPPYVRGLAEAGYATGSLDRALRAAADRLSADVRLSRKAVQTLAYPLLVLLVFGVVACVVSFVAVPAFEGLYTAVGRNLPWPTRAVVGFARLVRAGWPVLVAGAASLPLLWAWAARSPAARRLVASLPVLGGILSDIRGARLLRVLASLHGAGLVMTRCMEVAAESMPEDPGVARGMRLARAAVESGRSVVDALRSSGLLSEDTLEMIRAGEESGRLGQCMEDAAAYLEARAEHSTRMLATVAEPAAALLVGGVAAAVAVSLYLPVFDIPSLLLGR